MIHGTIIYKDDSKGHFSFKYKRNLLKMLSKEDFKEVYVYKDLKGGNR